MRRSPGQRMTSLRIDRFARRRPDYQCVAQIGTRVAHAVRLGREFGSTMRSSGTRAITRNDGVRGSSPRVGLLEGRKSLQTHMFWRGWLATTPQSFIARE